MSSGTCSDAGREARGSCPAGTARSGTTGVGVTVQVLFKSVKIAFAVGTPQWAQRGGGS